MKRNRKHLEKQDKENLKKYEKPILTKYKKQLEVLGAQSKFIEDG